MPTVSVIMPCHDAAATLATTLRSLRAQTHGDWQLIAIDDASTDETGDVLAAAARCDGRIRVIDGPGRGVSAARNAGLEVARGDTVAFLDADDVWMPERLARLLRTLGTRTEGGIAYSRFAFFSRTPGDTPTESTVPEGPLTVIDLLAENRVGTMSNVVLRRATMTQIGLFREDMTHGEDREWLVRAASLGIGIVGVDALLLHYRTSTGGLSSDLMRMHEGWCESLETARRLGTLPSAPALHAAEAVYLRQMARRALRLGLPPTLAASLALRGAARSPRGFFAEGRRGALTLSAALAGVVAPATVRSVLANR